ncbi:hypothetical protein FB451DRAFT_1225909 [Mycena latifolia]|nr:hypothetical protein FB451DRAFT_1225909 [Mycena latifolia]
MQHSPAPLQFPSTPLSIHKTHPGPNYSAYKPINSSPLAATNSSPGSSPIAAVQARRRSQYKAHSPSLPVASSSRSNSAKTRPVRPSGPQFGEASDDAQKAFLRTRLKLRCIERASKARERAVKKKRFMSSSEAGSDDMDAHMDMDDEDDEGEDPMFDELFSRIMKNADRKMQHAYLYSYDREVGSDPALDDSFWENELGSYTRFPLAQWLNFRVAAQIDSQDEATAAVEDGQDDAALEAYLEEQAAFADFADIPADDLFSWSDLDEDLLATTPLHSGGDMDMS